MKKTSSKSKLNLKNLPLNINNTLTFRRNKEGNSKEHGMLTIHTAKILNPGIKPSETPILRATTLTSRLTTTEGENNVYYNKANSKDKIPTFYEIPSKHKCKQTLKNIYKLNILTLRLAPLKK